MKESRFVDQNKEKWASFEEELKQKKKDPDKLSDLFVQLTDDLSFSRTYYPNRLVRAYLNSISQKIYLNFYKNKKNHLKNFIAFWKEDVPYIVYESRRELLIAFLIFTLATLIGVLSCLKDPSYAEVIVGKGYVEKTNDNIAKGDPMAVYKNSESFMMFLRIFWNNIRVAFYTFVLGVTAGIGTLFILLQNGTMLGGFQFFFFDKGVFKESLVTVWQHGTIEILSIIIAGGAGLVLAKGLIMPDTFPRLQSLQIATKKGLKIMLALSPFILTAALIEGYITRLTDSPMILRLGLIVASLVLMLGYWVYYPWRKKREGFSQAVMNRAVGFERPIEEKVQRYSLVNIKTVGQIFNDSFRLFNANLGRFFLFSLFIATLYGIAHVHYASFEPNYYSGRDFIDVLLGFLEDVFLSFFSFFRFSSKPIIQLLNMAMLGSLFPLTFVGFDKVFGLHKDLSRRQKVFNFVKYFLYGALAAVLLYGVFYFDSGLSYLFFMLLIPFVVMPFSALFYDKRNPFFAFKMLLSNFGSMLIVLLVFFLLFLCFMLIANVGLSSLLLDFIKMNFKISAEQMLKFHQFASAFLGIFSFSFFFPIFIYGFTFKYYSSKEQQEAGDLMNRINEL